MSFRFLGGRSRRTALLGTLVAGLAAANLAMAVERLGTAPALGGDHDDGAPTTASDAQSATWWSTYHWDKSTIRVWPQSTRTEILRAVNIWNNRTDVTHPSSTSHTDVSIWDANYGDIGWRGLASVNYTNDSHGRRITHCHARLNRFYTSAPAGRSTSWRWEGTLCQEMGHCLGLGHDRTGGCMDSSGMNSGSGSNTPSAAEVRLIDSRY